MKGKRYPRTKAQRTNRFALAPQANIQRSVLNRSHGHKFTCDAGYLIPIFVDEVLPGDTMSLRPTIIGRLQTLLFPLMDQLIAETFFFFVPNRLVWDNFQEFMGEETNPGQSVQRRVPVIEATNNIGEDTIYDYAGIPTQQTNQEFNALPFRGMNLIFNEWFRSQDLQQKLVENKGDGPDPQSDYKLFRRGKRHDYFSAALPFAQKGQPVSLSIGGMAPVTGSVVSAGTGEFTWDVGAAINRRWENSGSPSGFQLEGGADPGAPGTYFTKWNTPNLQAGGDMQADLANATAITVNQMRELFQVQRLLERDARGGTRYTEVLRSHFKVTSPDQRLQRPEWLGGSSNPINVFQVPVTAGSFIPGPDRSVADLGAFGMFQASGRGFTKSFVEHGFVIGFMAIRSNLTYQQGLERFWSRRDKYDYYWPTLAHLGEQPVLQKEIYSTGVPAEDDKVFGYQERYAEYRYKPSRVSGAFRSNYPAGSLQSWHCALYFDSAPLLNENFIEDRPPVDRIVAVPDQAQFLVDAHFDFRHVRPMPVYSVPGMIDHF